MSHNMALSCALQMLSANTNLTESIIRVWSGDWNINIFTSKENNLNIVVLKKKVTQNKGEAENILGVRQSTIPQECPGSQQV